MRTILRIAEEKRAVPKCTCCLVTHRSQSHQPAPSPDFSSLTWKQAPVAHHGKCKPRPRLLRKSPANLGHASPSS